VICPACGIELQQTTTPLSEYATMTTLTCPQCGASPGGNPLVEKEALAFRERVSRRLDALGLRR
jgi:hypothetical protein